MPLTDEQKQQAAMWRVQGLGGRLIARQIGAPYGQVRRWLETRDEDMVFSRVAVFDATDYRPVEGEQVHISWDPDGLYRVGTQPPIFRAVTFDLECTNLKTDLGVLVAVAFHDMHTRQTISRTLDDFGPRKYGEKQLALWAKEQIEAADVIIGFNSQGFDHHYVNGVLTRHKELPIHRRLVIDLYQSARYGWTGLPSSYSLRNLTHFFGLPIEKHSMDKEVWRQALTDTDALQALRVHCEHDVERTAELWEFLKQFHFDWRGR